MSLQDKAPANIFGFKRLARRFHAARRGNIAMMTAFLMMPIMGLMGLAVDYGNALYVKSRLDQAAQAAATAAAATARNYMQSLDRSLSDYNQNTKDAEAVSEGNFVGGQIFGAQFGELRNGEKDTPTVSVKRVGNTYTATVAYNARLNTYFARLFGVPVFRLSGTRSIIVGMVDTSEVGGANAKPNAVIDEKWLTTATPVNGNPANPVVNDWYSGTAGTASPLSTTGGPTINGAPSGRMQIGSSDGSIAPILSKKVYLPAGDYELRYWYQSTVIYPEYEPAYICGSVEGEMHWATSSTTRALGSSPTIGTTPAGTNVTKAQSARAGAYLVPVFGNPQADVNAPVVGAFPRPPRLPFTGGADRADNSKNRIDICTYSGRWIQRSVPITITVPGYFWLSFVAEPPVSTPTTNINGFYLGPLQLCKVLCEGTLNRNWPWTTSTVLFNDDFTTATDRSASPGAAMVTTSGTFPTIPTIPPGAPDPNYELTPPWLLRVFGGLDPSRNILDDVATYPLFTYERKTDSGVTLNFVNAKRSGAFMFRKILLVPGVYRATFTLGMGDATYGSWVTDKPRGSYYCGWGPAERKTDDCNCFTGAPSFAITHFDQLGGAMADRELDASIRSTVSGYYYNVGGGDPNLTPDPSVAGSILQSCLKNPLKRTIVSCFLVPRTAFYGFNFRNSGPDIIANNPAAPFNRSYFPDVDPSDLTIGSGGSRLYALKIEVWSQGVKNSRTADFIDSYGNDCSGAGGSSLGNVMTAGTPVWPGLQVPNAKYGTPPARLTVKAPLQ